MQALGEMGNLYVLRGEPDRALPYLQRGLDEAKAASLTAEAARLAGNLASATIDLRRWDEAERYNQEAQRLWLDTHPAPSVYHLLNGALIAKGRGQLDESARLLTQVIASPGSPPSVLWDAHFDLASVELARKQPDRAAAEFEAALAVIETTRAGLLRTDDKVSYLTRLISFYQNICLGADRPRTDRSRARGRRLEPGTAARRSVRRRRPPPGSRRRTFSASPANRTRSCCRTGSTRSGRGCGSFLLAACSCCRCRRRRRSKRWCAGISPRSPTPWPICSGRAIPPATRSTRCWSRPRRRGFPRMRA